jgi:RNA polymerase sigma-70 factor (ECF subfamily)
MSSSEQKIRARIAAPSDIGLETTATRVNPDLCPLEITPEQRAHFEALYREHFDFVFRSLRRLGVGEATIDDALQDVYLVVLRRIHEYRAGTHAKAWLFATALRVASNHRRGQRRRGEPLALEDAQLRSAQPGPFELTAQSEARRLLHDFLQSLDTRRRAVFVMAELEQMTAPEIAQALSANLNTVYSWLRSARLEFVRVLEASGHGATKPRG